MRYPGEVPSLTVITWNVLHRVHADNWQEPSIGAHPDERVRIAAITSRAAELLTQADALLLQEVSGDQLAALRAAATADGALTAVADRVSVASFLYPRVPTPRRGPSPLGDRSEHLVIVCGDACTPLSQHAFADDLGKGTLAVTFQEASVLCAHLSHGERHRAQWAEVAALVGRLPAPVILGGDLNADRKTAAALLGPSARWAAPSAGGRPTRPRVAPSEKSMDIDHVVAWGGEIEQLEVLDGQGLSDHNPVRARIRWS